MAYGVDRVRLAPDAPFGATRGCADDRVIERAFGALSYRRLVGLTGDFVTGPDAPLPPTIVARVRAACAHLPEISEEHPYAAVRWCIRSRTLAELKTRDHEGQLITYVTFHARDELDDLLALGEPFHPGWGPGLVAMVLTEDDTTDWNDVRELLTESYRLLAPKKLVAQLP
jgi:hypothetical protein